MNSFKTTKIYSLIDEIFLISPKVANLNQWIGKYTIDRDKYDYLVQISKTYKFPLTKSVVNVLERGEVLPYNSQDPKNPDDKPMSIPTSITSFSTPDKVKKVITYVDTSMKASYVRNKTTKEIEAYAINERDFYCAAQRGYVARYLFMNNSALSTTPKFVKAVINSYARIMAKPISAVYGTGAKEQWTQKLLYITIVYGLQNFFDMETEKAKEFALTFPGINRAYIMQECKFYSTNKSEIFNMRSSIDPKARFEDFNKKGLISAETKDKKNALYNIDIYVLALKHEFEEMRTGNISDRTILDRFTSMYGQNSMTAMEHCESFINMILTSELKCGIYNDRGIYDIAKDDVKSICEIIASDR